MDVTIKLLQSRLTSMELCALWNAEGVTGERQASSYVVVISDVVNHIGLGI